MDTLVHHALSQSKDESEILAHDNLSPTVLGALLAAKIPERREPTDEHMMIRINNVRRFFEAIKPWLTDKNGGVDRSFSIGVTDTDEVISFEFARDGLRLGDTRLAHHQEISRPDLTSVIFGPHPARPVRTVEMLTDFFPFYFPIWQLDHS